MSARRRVSFNEIPVGPTRINQRERERERERQREIEREQKKKAPPVNPLLSLVGGDESEPPTPKKKKVLKVMAGLLGSDSDSDDDNSEDDAEDDTPEDVPEKRPSPVFFQHAIGLDSVQKTTSILKPPSSDILIDHSLMTDMTGNDAAEYTLSSNIKFRSEQHEQQEQGPAISEPSPSPSPPPEEARPPPVVATPTQEPVQVRFVAPSSAGPPTSFARPDMPRAEQSKLEKTMRDEASSGIVEKVESSSGKWDHLGGASTTVILPLSIEDEADEKEESDEEEKPIAMPLDRVTEAFVTGIDVMLTRYPHEDQAWGASSDTEDETSSRKSVVSEKDDTASLEELVAEVRSGMDFALHSLTATISLADRLGGKEKVEADKKAAEQKARVAALNKQRSKMLQDARKIVQQAAKQDTLTPTPFLPLDPSTRSSDERISSSSRSSKRSSSSSSRSRSSSSGRSSSSRSSRRHSEKDSEERSSRSKSSHSRSSSKGNSSRSSRIKRPRSSSRSKSPGSKKRSRNEDDNAEIVEEVIVETKEEEVIDVEEGEVTEDESEEKNEVEVEEKRGEGDGETELKKEVKPEETEEERRPREVVEEVEVKTEKPVLNLFGGCDSEEEEEEEKKKDLKETTEVVETKEEKRDNKEEREMKDHDLSVEALKEEGEVDESAEIYSELSKLEKAFDDGEFGAEPAPPVPIEPSRLDKTCVWECIECPLLPTGVWVQYQKKQEEKREKAGNEVDEFTAMLEKTENGEASEEKQGKWVSEDQLEFEEAQSNRFLPNLAVEEIKLRARIEDWEEGALAPAYLRNTLQRTSGTIIDVLKAANSDWGFRFSSALTYLDLRLPYNWTEKGTASMTESAKPPPPEELNKIFIFPEVIEKSAEMFPPAHPKNKTEDAAESEQDITSQAFYSVFDQNYNAYYYLNRFTGDVSWTPPTSDEVRQLISWSRQHGVPTKH